MPTERVARTLRPLGGRLAATGIAFAAAAALPVAARAAVAEEPLDAFAAAAEYAPTPAASYAVVIDAFADSGEYLPFPQAEVPFDAWAEAGDRSPFLPLAPTDEAGTFDALAVLGDDLEHYSRASLFAGGYGGGEKRCVILMYHRFRAAPTNKYEVSFADFRAQLEYIARNGYEVIPIGQLLEALHEQEPDLLPPRSVVITIDDGYRCVYDFAWPLLSSFGFPFAIYIYTDYIAVGGKSMSWRELRDLAADGLVTVGAHSISHPNLANPRRAVGPYDAWVWRQLTYPEHLLAAELGKPVRTFAWPYGSFNSFTVDAAIRAGYEGLLTVQAGANSMETSPYYLRRYGVYWHTPLSTFARILEGHAVADEMFAYGAATEMSDELLIP